VVLTEWPEFRDLDLKKVYEVMASGPTIVDTRNVLDPEEVRRLGFNHAGIALH
jgi:UDPglucose 6-dehydrogenase